ncbi:MAG: hypothetical protein ACI9EW_003798 [Cellvibrionaceae bacterium]|jgi:hypothetical protein
MTTTNPLHTKRVKVQLQGQNRKKRKPQPQVRSLQLLLASGGVIGTLIGGNLIAGNEWVESLVPTHQTDEALLESSRLEIAGNITTEVHAYTPPVIKLPDVSRLPQPIANTDFEIPQRVKLIDQSAPQNIGGFGSGLNSEPIVKSSVQLPEIPLVAVPVIPQRPQVNIQPVNLDLPEIPQVQVAQPSQSQNKVPQTVTASKSSK